MIQANTFALWGGPIYYSYTVDKLCDDRVA